MYDQFREFAFIIQVAAISVTVCALLIIYMLLRLLVKSRKRRKRKKILKRLDKRYGDGIRHLMSAESKQDLTREEIIEILDLKKDNKSNNYANLLKKGRDKWAFCKLVYQSRISDEAEQDRTQNIQTLLRIFELPQFLEAVVNRAKMDKKVEAMTMLNAFKLTVNMWIANSMLGSKRNRAKRVASYASIMTNSNSDLEYFESDFFDNNCCIYDEIQLGYILQRRKSSKRKIPNMAHFAHIHKDPQAQCIFIRMMRQFNQKEYCAELEELFQHQSDKSVIEEISRTWGYLKYVEGEELMRDMMFTQSDDTKVTIMHALARLNTGQSLSSIVDAYQHSGSQRVRFEALRSLYNYGPIGKAKFNEIRLAATKEEDLRMFEFFNNPLTAEDVALPKTDIYEQTYGDNLYSVV